MALLYSVLSRLVRRGELVLIEADGKESRFGSPEPGRDPVVIRFADRSVGGAILRDRDWTFWTLTAWDGPESMRAYMLASAHRAAMPHLSHWCDEACTVHWDAADLPGDLPEPRVSTRSRP